jgi:PQQ-like domain
LIGIVALMLARLGTPAIALTGRTDPVGQERLWQATYDGPGSPGDIATAATTSPDGERVFVTGHSSGSQSTLDDWATVAYNAATGAELWATRYDGPGNGTDWPSDVIASPDGSTIYVAGFTYGQRTHYDGTVIAYNAGTGAQKWIVRYNRRGSLAEYFRTLGVSPDGTTVFVGGETDRSASDSDFVTLALDAATGAQRWAELYTQQNESQDAAWDLGLSPDGGLVYVTGRSGPDGSEDYLTIAYDAITGSQGWVERFDGPRHGQDWPFALRVSPDGTVVFVSGRTAATDALSSDFGTLAYDAASGDQRWVAFYNGPGHGSDSTTALSVSPDGARLVVSGYGTGGGIGNDITTLSYDAATGGQEWVSRFNGPANSYDSANAAGVSLDGSRVFVAGYSSSVDADFTTLIYDLATGRRVGIDRIRDGYANALAVGPDGSAFYVAGSRGRTYLTVAYGLDA